MSTAYQQLEKILFFSLFLTYIHLYPLFCDIPTFFLALRSYVPNFYKLIHHLQWGIHSFWRMGKSAKIS